MAVGRLVAEEGRGRVAAGRLGAGGGRGRVTGGGLVAEGRCRAGHGRLDAAEGRRRVGTPLEALKAIITSETGLRPSLVLTWTSRCGRWDNCANYYRSVRRRVTPSVAKYTIL